MTFPAEARDPDPANPDLLDRIPLTARLVLDIGCSTGLLGARYKARNPAAKFIGLERDPTAAATAAQRLDEVFIGDVETLGTAFLPQSGFDCIIYGDVLEHLVDPAAVLSAHARLLAPHGLMLICVPNVEHWSFAARLLTGKFAYEPNGLFDSGHLRWFSLTTMADTLRQAGLALIDVTPRVFAAEQHQQFLAAITPALNGLGVDPADYARRSAALQYVWRAQPSVPPRLHLVTHMLPPEGGVSHVRVVYPTQGLFAETSLITHLIVSGDVPDLAIEAPKVIVLHRLVIHGAGGLQTLRKLLARRFVVVMEFDDNPDHMTQLQVPDVHSFSGVHAVQTSTQPLAEVLARANPEVMVFPNAVPELLPPGNFSGEGPIRLFFGSFNRAADWQPYMAVLNEVAALAGARLWFEVVHDEAFFAALDTPHKRFTPMCDHATYLGLLARCELAFMPLLDTPFNRCKSDLKFIEAAAARVCAIASPVVYAGSIEEMQTGVLFRDAAELRQILSRLVGQPDLALAMAERAREWVRRHRMLAYQVAARAAWYHSLWERRDALNDALLARLPALVEAP